MNDKPKSVSLEQEIKAKKVGDTLAIFSPQGEKLTLTIIRLGSSVQEADRLGIAVPTDILIYYLDKDLPFMDAGIGHGGDTL